jgi:hypothetical protein
LPVRAHRLEILCHLSFYKSRVNQRVRRDRGSDVNPAKWPNIAAIRINVPPLGIYFQKGLILAKAQSPALEKSPALSRFINLVHFPVDIKSDKYINGY